MIAPMIIRKLSEFRRDEFEAQIVEIAQRGAAELLRNKIRARAIQTATQRSMSLRLGIMPASQAGPAPGTPPVPHSRKIPTLSDFMELAALQGGPVATVFGGMPGFGLGNGGVDAAGVVRMRALAKLAKRGVLRP
jgi:hypothetical protein